MRLLLLTVVLVCESAMGAQGDPGPLSIARLPTGDCRLSTAD